VRLGGAARGHADDHARALGRHDPRGAQAAVEDAAQVDVDDLPPPGVVRFQEMALGVDQAGVVDEHVDRAVAVLDRPEEAVAVGGRGHVALHGQALAARVRDRSRDLLGSLLVDVPDHHPRALAPVPERDRPPDAGAAAGDDRYLPRQVCFRHPHILGVSPSPPGRVGVGVTRA